MSENLNDTCIDPICSKVTIIAYKGMRELIVGLDELKWRIDGGCEEFLTLKDISEQLIKLGYGRTYYVWYETGLRGVIYQYGNYEPPTWVQHGTTKGYA